MAILIDETKRVLVQGITGREGQARTRLMREYGTNVVAGVTPGKGGQRVLGGDAMQTAAGAKANGAMFVGPNTRGVLSPGKAVVGMIGGRAESARQWFKPGIPTGVGVISRSGGMASSTGFYLGQAGVRISTIAHIGTDAVLGIRIPDAALMFEACPVTQAIVIFGAN